MLHKIVFLLYLYAIPPPQKKDFSSYENLTVKEWWLIQKKMASCNFVYACISSSFLKKKWTENVVLMIEV